MFCVSAERLQAVLISNRLLQSTYPRCFFSWRDMIVNNDVGYFPYTPSTPFLHGLREALDMLLEEGIENVWERHHRLVTTSAIRCLRCSWDLTQEV
mmetsp:Transcript_3006/g.14226  ORF Transcript_3006/g.14226 Transcript_3006/m.14226 type:complete len:96 (+) Transcript_3006:988-1275(+)